MLLGSRLGPARTAGICAVSPALYQSYTASTFGAFDSYDDWTHNTVFGSPALSTIPLRIDCGNDDRFAPATHQFIAQLHTPPAGGFTPGGHDEAYWRQQLPASSPGWHPDPDRSLNCLSRKLFVTTSSDEQAIAAPEIIGFSRPNAASGMAAAL